jgi:putative adhesin
MRREDERDERDAAKDETKARADAERDAATDQAKASGDAERGPWTFREGREERRAEREARRAARDAEREARHAEHAARRAEHRSHRFEFRSGPGGGFTVDGSEFDPGRFARAFVGDFGADVGGQSHSDTVEERFAFKGTPKLRVRNVSGETSVSAAGAPGEIRVVARKRVSAGSEDRAKRLLQNLEVRMEKRGDELLVEPHLYEQERGWLDLFRGKRFRVDFDITVPAECAVDAQTVSGELSVEGVHGPLEVQTVSGDVRLEDVQGPLRLKSVSGDVDCRRYVGHLEGNTVSGDVTMVATRLRSSQLHTVSGDVEIEGNLDARKEHHFKTISGDVELALSDADVTIDYRTASGDVECELPARIVRSGRKEYSVVIGGGQGRVGVKTVSGDLTVRGTSAAPGEGEPEETAEDATAEDVEKTQPMDMSSREEVRSVLERVARGDLGIDDAAAALDAARRGR